MSACEHPQEHSERGLSSAEAQMRLARDGHNEIPSAIRRNTLAIALSVAREPIFLLLIASAVVYFLLGDVRELLVKPGASFIWPAVATIRGKWRGRPPWP